MKSVVLVVISLFVVGVMQPQANDTEAALYNVGFGAVFGTVCAIINKGPEDKLGTIIKKSLWQGALGGYVIFESKRILREAVRQDEWSYFWVAKLVNAAGTSIKENAALNNDFWERWHLNIGFNRIEVITKDKFSVNYKLMPMSFGYVMDAFFRYEFKFEESLRVGDFLFVTNRDFNNNNFINVDAISRPGYIVLEDEFINNKELQTHEIVHQYQSNDFSILNTYTQKAITKIASKNKLSVILTEHLYLEFHYLIYWSLYVLERNSSNSYYDNFLEHEAEYYGRGF